MNNKLIILLSFIFCFNTINAQTKNTIAEKYASSITEKDLKDYLYQLAGDEFLGRETGEIGQKLAAEYLSNKFRSFGIPPLADGSYYQKVPLIISPPAEVMINLAGNRFNDQSDFFFTRGLVDTSLAQNKVYCVGYGIDDEKYSDYAGLEDVSGKFILILPGDPMDKRGNSRITGSGEISNWAKNSRKKIALAKTKNPSVIFYVTEPFEETRSRFTHYIESKSMKLATNVTVEKDIPVFYISKEMGDKLISKSGYTIDKLTSSINKHGKTLRVESLQPLLIDIDKKVEKIDTENVLAYIEGSDLKDELVVLTAHYDHLGESHGKIYYGADDNASGTSAMIELAEAFAQAKKEGNGPRRSVLIMAVTAEEKGLLGSLYYTDNPVFPLSSTVANLNIDMIGRRDKKYADDPNYVYVIGSDKLSSELHTINEQMNTLYTNITLDYVYNDDKDPNKYYSRSDHYNFAKNNIPVIFYFNGSHEDYHEASDTKEKIEFGKMEKITRLVFYTAWELANRDKRISVDKISIGKE